MRLRSFPAAIVFVAMAAAAAPRSRSSSLHAIEDEIGAILNRVGDRVVTVRATFAAPTDAGSGASVVNIGTGLIVDSLGYVVTASSVVSNESTVAPYFTVIDRHGHSHAALLFALRPDLRVAVLYAPKLATSTQLAIRDSSWAPGRIALGVGDSFGVGPSVTFMTVAGERSSDGFWQLSEPATPGYSGAPVFDSDGALGGVIVGEVSIPGISPDRPLPAIMVSARQLRPVLANLESLSRGTGSPWLGIKVKPSVQPDGQPMISVMSVVTGSPADAAGFETGDVVMGVDSLDVSYMSDLAGWIRRRHPGDRAEIHIIRAGEPRTIVVTVGRR